MEDGWDKLSVGKRGVRPRGTWDKWWRVELLMIVVLDVLALCVEVATRLTMAPTALTLSFPRRQLADPLPGVAPGVPGKVALDVSVIMVAVGVPPAIGPAGEGGETPGIPSAALGKAGQGQDWWQVRLGRVPGGARKWGVDPEVHGGIPE